MQVFLSFTGLWTSFIGHWSSFTNFGLFLTTLTGFAINLGIFAKVTAMDEIYTGQSSCATELESSHLICPFAVFVVQNLGSFHSASGLLRLLNDGKSCTIANCLTILRKLTDHFDRAQTNHRLWKMVQRRKTKPNRNIKNVISVDKFR